MPRPNRPPATRRPRLHEQPRVPRPFHPLAHRGPPQLAPNYQKRRPGPGGRRADVRKTLVERGCVW
eukprot:6428088-Lingulodinium_polyedra.AAC.1